VLKRGDGLGIRTVSLLSHDQVGELEAIFTLDCSTEASDDGAGCAGPSDSNDGLARGSVAW